MTGAATGIGEALVVRLQREGWQVFATYRTTPPEKARWFGLSNVTAVRCDVAELEEPCRRRDHERSHVGHP